MMKNRVSLTLLSLFECFGCCSCGPKISSTTNHSQFPIAPFQHLGVSQEKNLTVEDTSIIQTSRILREAEAVFVQNLTSRNDRLVSSTLQALALCHHSIAEEVLSKHIDHDSPFLQLAALQALSYLGTTEATKLIHKGLQSQYPIVRIEALYRLIDFEEKSSVEQINALKEKLPEEFHIYLAELYAKDGSFEAIQKLKTMLYEGDDQQASQVLLSVYKYNVKDFEDVVISYTSHSSSVLEAQAQALELFQTDRALTKLKEMSQLDSPFVRMRALASRITMNDSEAIHLAQSEYERGNELIIAAILGAHISELQSKPIFPIVINEENEVSAIQYWLLNQDPRGAELVQKLLISSDSMIEPWLFVPSSSPGLTTVLWQKRPQSYLFNPKISQYERLYLKEQSLQFEESLIQMACRNISEKEYMPILYTIADQKREELYPLLFNLLQEVSYESFIEFVTTFEDRPGSPYIRAYTQLAKMKRLKHFDRTIMKKCYEVARTIPKTNEDWRVWLPFFMNDLPYNVRQEEENRSLESSLKLYLLSCQISLELAQNESISLLYDELQTAPQELKPFVAAILLEAIL